MPYIIDGLKTKILTTMNIHTPTHTYTCICTHTYTHTPICTPSYTPYIPLHSLIATPGRFMHVMVEMNMNLSNVEYVVFDEADRLFEMGFQEHLLETMKRLPETRQTLLFSATLPR